MIKHNEDGSFTVKLVDFGAYSSSLDMWSVGVMMHNIYMGKRSKDCLFCNAMDGIFNIFTF